MSGGVDSSVAAALLKEAGFDVIGVFMKFWSEGTNRCCSPESEERARLVAAKLNIPFYTFCFKRRFKKEVVDYFIKASKLGLTPNPCVVCNKEIKFGLLFEKTASLKYDFIATGHYALIKHDKLFKAKDKDKDQTYFLWKLNKKTLAKTLFPVGGYTKLEVKKLAKQFKLPVVDIPESQEACFISTTVNDFLKKHLKPKPGPIVLRRGANYGVVGQHKGLFLYTIGQRKGINLPAGPFYVLDKDIKNNALIITKKERDLFKKELIAKDINWIDKAPKLPLEVKVKIRYRHKPASALIKKQGKVVFLKPQRAITPGQSVVFYSKDQVLGGGVIT